MLNFVQVLSTDLQREINHLRKKNDRHEYELEFQGLWFCVIEEKKTEDLYLI